MSVRAAYKTHYTKTSTVSLHIKNVCSVNNSARGPAYIIPRDAPIIKVLQYYKLIVNISNKRTFKINNSVSKVR